MTNKCTQTIILVLSMAIMGSAMTLKVQDIVKSGSDVVSQALTQAGLAQSQSQSIANANRVLVNSPILQQRQDDQTAAVSRANSDSLTGLGDSVGSAVSYANAARQEVNPVGYGNNDLVAALAGASTTAGTDKGNAAALSGASALTSNLKYDGTGNIIQTAQNVQYATGSWYNTGKKVNECAVGAYGDIFCIGVDKRVYYYDILTENFNLVKGDFQLEGVVKIAAASDGTLYAVTVTGETFYYSCRNTWIRIEGCATDIAVGVYGEVYKIGCDVKNAGLAVYKLFCQGDSCFKGCKRHRLDTLVNDFDDERSCHWFRIEGAGVRIAVGPSGQPIVTRVDGSIYAFNGSDWEQMGSLNAVDLCATNEGIVYAVGKDGNVYKQKENIVDKNKNTRTYTYNLIKGVSSASAITCAPLNLPFVTASGSLWHCINTPYN